MSGLTRIYLESYDVIELMDRRGEFKLTNLISKPYLKNEIEREAFNDSLTHLDVCANLIFTDKGDGVYDYDSVWMAHGHFKNLDPRKYAERLPLFERQKLKAKLKFLETFGASCETRWYEKNFGSLGEPKETRMVFGEERNFIHLYEHHGTSTNLPYLLSLRVGYDVVGFIQDNISFCPKPYSFYDGGRQTPHPDQLPFELRSSLAPKLVSGVLFTEVEILPLEQNDLTPELWEIYNSNESEYVDFKVREKFRNLDVFHEEDPSFEDLLNNIRKV